MRLAYIFVLFLYVQLSYAQLFDHPDRMEMVSKGVNYIYNIQPDSANIYIKKVSAELPNHPVVPMMRALNVLWENIPVVTVDEVFKEFSGHLMEAIRLSAYLDGGRQEHPEAIFFEMSARGLLAEYYADAGHYMKALSEAGKAYVLVKAGFKLSDEIPEFLLTTGVYNYFREKYPEKYPVYKPLLWFFRSGDVELGLQQIEEATERAVLSRVEAYVYLAYIYLRYEYEPRKAQKYLYELNRMYPRNPYIKAKLLESLTPGADFKRASLTMIRELTRSSRPYYSMAGNAFLGLYFEKNNGNPDDAIKCYRKAIAVGSDITGHGSFYRSLSYLGLGRIYTEKGYRDKAVYNLHKALEYSDSEEIDAECEKLLEEIE